MHRYDFYYDTSVHGIPSTDVCHDIKCSNKCYTMPIIDLTSYLAKLMVDYVTKEEFEFAKEDMQTLVDYSLVGEHA